jgi:DNA-binding MarR family transcriptional regulator
MDNMVHVSIESLGISQMAEWDVLVFLHRHGVSLLRPDKIASFIGYEEKVVEDAMDRLESRGLIARSRPFEKAHLYQVSVSIHAENSISFQQMMSLADTREGRLLVAREIKLATQKQAQQRNELNQEGSAKWSKKH